MIEVDVETTTVQWYWIGHGERLFLVQFKRDDEEAVVLRHPEDREAIQAWLDTEEEYQDTGGFEIDFDHGFRAWNSKFDFHVLEQAGYRLPPMERWHDGMVASAILDERMLKGLKPRHEKLFGKGSGRGPENDVKRWLDQERARRKRLSKETGEAYQHPTYADIPDEIILPYALGDVDMTADIGRVYFPRLKRDHELGDIYELEMKVMQALYDAERRGMPVDVPNAHRLELSVAENLSTMHEELRELAGKSNFNPNSPRQVEEALVRRGADMSRVELTDGCQEKNREAGKRVCETLSMSDENLQGIDDELAYAIRRFRSEDKMHSSYVVPMLHDSWDGRLRMMIHPYIGPDNRLHPNFNQVGARTGRMSASNPNAQNMPRDDLRLRYLIEAPPGFKIVSADLSGVELVLFAAFLGPGKLLSTVREGGDMHTLAADVVSLEDYVRASGDIEPRRQRGKTWNYSIIYGAGERSIMRHFHVDRQRARQMKAQYLAYFPEIQDFQTSISIRLADHGFVRNGAIYKGGRRHQRAGELGAREAYKFLNYVVQGTAAEIVKVATVRAYERGVPIIAVVHDELVALSPEDKAEEHASIMQEVLTDHPTITNIVGLNADADIGDRWSQAKKPLYIPDYARRDL